MMPLRNLRRALEIGTAACAAAALIVIASREAGAHSWYEPRCCNEQDCAPISSDSVRLIPGVGYEVTLSHGQHFKVREGQTVTRIIRFDEARPSQDADFHGCVLAGRILCLYAPTGGV